MAELERTGGEVGQRAGEPRLGAMPRSDVASVADVLCAWVEDLRSQLDERVRRADDEALHWRPDEGANSVGVTVWHVARWLDYLGTRAFTGAPAAADLWHQDGWAERTGYEPDGLGYAGLGLLTGYSPEQMRAVPRQRVGELRDYLAAAARRLVEQVRALDRAGQLLAGVPGRPSPYQAVAATVQGGFGHVGEIDALLALRARAAAGQRAAGDDPGEPDPAAGVVAAVDHLLARAQTWTGWDGVPLRCDDRVYTPHKAVRRLADHLLDHLAELDARLAGEAPQPDRWHASQATTPADLAPFTQEDLDEARSRLARLAQLWRLRLAALPPEQLDAEDGLGWTPRELARHLSSTYYADAVGDLP